MSLSKPEEQLAHELSCPICLQLFSDPVVLPCGHNYCWACIRKTADRTDKAPHCCPECREEYQGVDTLKKNFKLCSIIEGYQATAAQTERQPERQPESLKENEPETTKVLCDHCIDKESPAVKTCLSCEVSLCSGHLQRHQEKEWLRAHTVVEPLGELGTNSCGVHRRPLEYFCSNDMSLMCGTCFIEGHHQNHDVLTFGAAEEEMRRALENRTKVVSYRLQVIESLLQKTAQEQGASEAIGDKLVDKAVTVMECMAALVDRYRESLRVLLEEERYRRRRSWQLGLSALEEQQQQLVEAQRSAAQALSETDTCIFIHRFVLIDGRLREVVTGSLPSGIPSKAPLDAKRLQVGLKTQDFRSEMSGLLDSLHILLNPLDLAFNVCTAHPSLLVSNDQRTVKYSPTKQPYAEHPERFTSAPQVLCSQGFSSGEHVWVVEVGANSMWSLGVCYKSIPRRGDHSRLGHNSVSWRLQWKNGKLTVCQSSCNVALGEMSHHPLRIEIALDYEAGTLMFHNIRGRREHLHTFRAVFREPVYPAFSLHSNTPESWFTLHNGM
ncbi:tripartite motif-containing protein 72-like [Cyclopterus lumpus]|uniref:tripartite motif-containing protein 72-like n=1 Tax=Cyclopterus lumpus TaxID=8103 RepID=UPI001485D7CA|nr:tripartite motif-containing protein 72-like [Cyclopterus lumpus]